jgi:adenylate cyclase
VQLIPLHREHLTAGFLCLIFAVLTAGIILAQPVLAPFILVGFVEVDGGVVRLSGEAPALLADLEHLLVYVWRRRIAATVERRALQLEAPEGAQDILTVGFADLVGFTTITQELEDHDVAQAVARFDATAHDLIGSHGGRTVKTIGDEVMFAAPGPVAGAVMALDLAEAFAVDPRLPDVRVGLAHGRTLAHQGDLFGPPVNLASRLVNIAYPGAVLVSEEIAASLDDDERFILKQVRGRRLKGVGRVRPWVLRRHGQDVG